jgi:hypothetical protein
LSPLVFISSDTMVCTSSGELRPTSSHITLLVMGSSCPQASHSHTALRQPLTQFSHDLDP